MCVLRFRLLLKIAKTFFMHVLGTLCMNCDRLFQTKKTKMTKFDDFLEIFTIIYKTLSNTGNIYKITFPGKLSQNIFIWFGVQGGA